MSYHIQFGQKNSFSYQDENRYQPNNLFSSLKELFSVQYYLNQTIYQRILIYIQFIESVEICEEAQQLGINYIEEIEEKGFEIVCVNSKLIIQKKGTMNIQKIDQKQNIYMSDYERQYDNSKAKYKQQVYHDDLLNNKMNSEIQLNSNFQKKHSQKSKNNYKKASITSVKCPYNYQNHSFFTQNLSSFDRNDFYLENQNDNNNQSNNPFQCSAISSFDNNYGEYIDSFTNERSQITENLDYNVDEIYYSQLSNENTKVNKFDSQQNQSIKKLAKKYQHLSQNQQNDIQNSSLQMKEQKNIFKSFYQKHCQLDQVNNKNEIQQSSNDTFSMKDYDDYTNLNLFENQETKFKQLTDEYLKKRALKQQHEIIPITHTQTDIKQVNNIFDEKTYSPIKQIKNESNKIAPKKIKSKLSKAFPQISNVLRKDRLIQKIKIQFNHPLIIQKVPGWIAKD